jgi:lysophospholipase L1-like esterase
MYFYISSQRAVVRQVRSPMRPLPRSPLRIAITVAVVTITTTVGLVATALPANAAATAYTALGDSYSSGVGTRSYYADGTSCQRSSYAYPVLDAAAIGAALSFAACSGSRVDDVLSGQLGSLNGSTTYVTVSVGGNDSGFSSVISQCAKPWPYTCWGDIDNAKAYMTNTLPGKLDQLYNTVRSKAPAARVVVVGYPRLFNVTDCQSLARISPGEQSALNGAADLLDSTIQGRASAHGFRFVDPRSAFTGHAVCDGSEWVNGLSNPISESYHPNRNGQSQGYAPLVKSALVG